jgi:hypothetical protein
MEFTSTVLFNEELTYYNVATRDGLTFHARLLAANESLAAQPPKEVVLCKKGNEWECNADEDVLYFLRRDIDRRLQDKGASVS